MSWTSIHSSSGTLSDLIPWIYLSLPMYDHKGFDLGHTWMVFRYEELKFFSFSLNLAIRSSWSEPQSAPSLVFADCIVSIFGCKEYNQSDFVIDHLVMSMCRVFSFVFERGCLLWPVHSLGKTLLAFALLHSIFQGHICLLLQVFLDFLLLHSSPL